MIVREHHVGIVRALYLGRGYFDEAAHHPVGGTLGVPAWKQQFPPFGRGRRLIEMLDYLLEPDIARDVPAGDDVPLAKGGQKNFTGAVAVPVVDNSDQTVLPLDPIGIRCAGALVEQEAFVPGLAVVGGEPRSQMAASRELIVSDQQQVARSQTAEEEARTGARNRAGFGLRPASAAIRGVAFPQDAAAGAHEHPQPAIAQFDHHVFERKVRRLQSAAQLPRLSLVRRNAHPLELPFVGRPFVGGLFGVGDRHDPFAGGKRGRLVEAKAKRHFVVAHAKFFAPHGGGCIRMLADTGVDPMPAAFLVGAIEQIPEPSARVEPQRRIESAVPIARSGHRHGLGECLAVIVAIGEIDRVLRRRLLWAA
jgi:hypothetical protein